MENIIITGEIIELTQGGQRYTIFREHIEFIEEQNNGSNIYIKGYDTPFYINLNYDILKIRLNLNHD